MEFNEDSRFTTENIIEYRTEHYKAHSLINYRTNMFADSIYYKIRLPTCLQLNKKIMLNILCNDIINHFLLNEYLRLILLLCVRVMLLMKILMKFL